MRLFLLLTLALLPGLSTRLMGAEKANYLPVAPSVLLSLLPKAPDGWKITASFGTNQPGSEPILATVAQRVYRFDPPPQHAGEPTPPPMSTELTVMDTAFAKGKLSFVEKASNRPNSERRYKIEGVSVVDTMQGKSRVIMAGFPPRFVLLIKLTNQNETQVAEWLRLLNFSAFLSAAESAPKLPLPPKTFTISYVNELKPEQNQTSQMSYQTEEEKAAEAQAQAEAYHKSHSPVPTPQSR